MSSGIPSTGGSSNGLINRVFAALAALFYWRAADAGNSRALANLGIGAVWNGVVQRTRGYARVDVTIVAVQQGTWYVFHGDVAADVTASAPGALVGATVQDVWNVPAGTNIPTTCALRADYYRLCYVQGAVAGNVTLAATLDPRAVDHEIPIYITALTPILAAGNLTVNRPPGSRTFATCGFMTGTVNPISYSMRCLQRDAAVAPLAQSYLPEGHGGAEARYPLYPEAVTLYLLEVGALATTVRVAFFP